MGNLEQYGNWLTTITEQFYAWLASEVFVPSALAQLAVILLAGFLASVFAQLSARWLETKLDGEPSRTPVRLHASYKEIFFLIYGVILLWAGVLIADAAELRTPILQMVASLATAWGIIRVTSSTIESPFWSRLVAFALWTLAALNILGWLGEATTLLDKASLQAGDTRLSLLLLIKSIMALGVILWGTGVISRLLESSFKKAKGLTPSQQVLFFKLSNIGLYTLAIILGLNAVGLDLTALTVFSGALGLGIGFGLQKVFSNLISGIILLLDKSVKPGDVIVVNDTFGWVNKLGARCASVITRDGKEHLIPNENLITQQVENWSYSNQHVRIHLAVGVSYDSDMKLVKELLLKSVEGSARILTTPPPVCFIVGFGDSSVDHELRFWITDPKNGVTNIKSEVYYRIWDLFKEHGVEIPFPQRDVHIKSGALDS